MKLDFDELSRGVKEAGSVDSMEKFWDKSNPGWRERRRGGIGTTYTFPGIGASVNIPNFDFWDRLKTSPESHAAVNLPGNVSAAANQPGLVPANPYSIPHVGGTLPWWMPDRTKAFAVHDRQFPEQITADGPLSDYIWKGVDHSARSKTLLGDLTAPLFTGVNAIKNTGYWLANKGINATRGGLDRYATENSPTYRGIKAVAGAVNDRVEQVLPESTPATPVPLSDRKTPLHGVAEFIKDPAGTIQKLYPNATNFAKDTWNNIGTIGQVATPLIGLGLTAILMHYFNKKKESRYPMGGGQPININIGGKPVHSMFENSGVGTFDKYGEYNTKEANLVVDSLATAVKNRIANKVLDTAVPTEQAAKKAPSEKELEITSKYPEMAKLLEDEKNKAYLERLLKQ